MSLGSPDITARIRVLHSPDVALVGHVLALEPGGRCVIGRASDSDLQVDDRELSRHHLAVARDEDGELTVADLASRNGTRVGRRRLHDGERRVIHDDVVRIGQTVLLVGHTVLGRGADDVDPWLTFLGRELLRNGHAAAIGNVNANALASVMLSRPERAGPVVILGTEDTGLDIASVQPPGTLLFDRPDPPALAPQLASLARAGLTAVVVSESVPEVIERLLGDGWCATVPPLRRRPDEVFRRTVARLGPEQVGRFVPMALVRWLLAPHTDVSLGAALDRLCLVATGAGPIDSRVVRLALAPPGPLLAPESRRAMWRPTRDELLAALASLGSVAAVASQFGRERRQIYRWMTSLGVARDA